MERIGRLGHRVRSHTASPATIGTTFLLAAILAGCASLPADIPSPEPGQALPSHPDGAFAKVEDELVKRYGPGSGFLLIDSNEEALRWRLALIDQARYSLDLAYYLWYPDISGGLLASRIIDAADRGVRVRLILDDFQMAGRDDGMALWNEHPNIEIRLFNPWTQRDLTGRALEYLQRIDRLDVRMHNKLIVADNQATIVGGRNIGDYYFGLADAFNFHDLDVLGVGPVARQTSGVFDHFWNSDWVLDASILDPDATLAEMRSVHSKLLEELSASDRLQRFDVAAQDWSDAIASLAEALVPGTSTVLHDTLEPDGIDQTMPDPLGAMLKNAQREVLITNAYLIPSETGIEALRQHVSQGVRFRILTNSLASHDIPLVNSRYGPLREPMLAAGFELYEMRPDPAIKSAVVDTAPVRSEFVGLHTKAVVTDRQRVFIGSMNFDPRSAAINTEMGVIIDSKELADQLAELMDRDMRGENSWRLELRDDELVWISDQGILTEQPARDDSQRLQDALFSLLPEVVY